jgi:hypothetical protein
MTKKDNNEMTFILLQGHRQHPSRMGGLGFTLLASSSIDAARLAMM